MKSYRIKTVARVTGLSVELLRAWERRYGVVKPSRTDGGYREYSEDDVTRLRRLRALTTVGYSIGELARLSDGELAGLLERAPDRDAGEARSESASTRLTALARGLDAVGFREGLRRVLLLPAPDAAREIQLLFDDLDAAPGGARRLATSEIRGFLGVLGGPAGAPLAVVRASPGDAPLRGCLCCVECGWQFVLVDAAADVPSLRRTVRAVSPAAAVIAPDGPMDKGALLTLLDEWAAATPEEGCALVMVGQALAPHAASIERFGARYARDTAELRTLLATLSSGDPR